MKNPFENGLNLSRYASKTGITTKVLVLAPALILGGSTLGVLLDRAAPAYAQEKPVNPDCTMTLRVEERDQDYDFLDRLAYGSLSLSKKDVPCNEAPQEAADLSAEFYRIKAEREAEKASKTLTGFSVRNLTAFKSAAEVLVGSAVAILLGLKLYRNYSRY